MIKFNNTQTVGWEPATRGMRNPMNSWEKSDSVFSEGGGHCNICDNPEPAPKIEKFPNFNIGQNDHDLMTKLSAAGSVHAKYRRMITVYVDITAPLYWWKEFDTYKVGTVANSCSSMHKIAEREFTFGDFSYEHLIGYDELNWGDVVPLAVLDSIILALNTYREKYLETKDKKYWWQMIQLLPSSYMQLRTVMLNYEVLANIYPSRKNHKLDEWRDFCEWIEKLPYSEVITNMR